MNIDNLVKMANEISAFFAGEPDTEQATREMTSHLKRFWEPRMRAQIIAYYEQRGGVALTELARRAVADLAAETSTRSAVLSARCKE